MLVFIIWKYIILGHGYSDFGKLSNKRCSIPISSQNTSNRRILTPKAPDEINGITSKLYGGPIKRNSSRERSEPKSSFYSWGWNEDGCCGVGTTSPVPKPIIIKDLSVYFINFYKFY